MSLRDILMSIYFRCPVSVQEYLCALEGKKLFKQRFGGDFQKIYNELLESDKFDVTQIREYKEQHIAMILRYAYDHCTFYRKKYDAAGVSPDDFKTLEDLRKFPILTKEEVRENLQDMISDEYDVKSLIKYHTSGSTGKALAFYWTKTNVQYFWAVETRGKHREGVKFRDSQLNFTGKLVAPLSQKKPPYWRYNKALNQYLINQQHITAEKVSSIVDFLNKTPIVFFSGYPSIVNAFATLINEQGLKVTQPPKYFFTGAEKVYENQREEIENAFPGIKILETYSFSEEAGSMRRCTCGNYHEDFEFGHFELANPNAMTDKLLVTGFRNYGMPFIRYEIGDTATLADEPCSCGLHSAAFKDIDGRNEDYILTPEGQRFTRLGYLFKEANFYESQIIQREFGSIIVRAVVRKGVDCKKSEESVRNEVRKHFSQTLKVRFEYVDEIPRTKAGKFKFIISELTPEEKRDYLLKLSKLQGGGKYLIIGALPDYKRGLFGGATVLMQNYLDFLDAYGLPYTFVRTNRYKTRKGKDCRFLNKIVFLIQFLATLPFHKVVMFNFSNNGVANMFPFLAKVSRSIGKKNVLRKFAGSLEDYLPNISKIKQRRIAEAINRADLILLETKAGIKHLNSWIPDSRGKTCWFPNVRQSSKQKKDTAIFNKRIVFFGHIKAAKGIEELIVLASKLPKDYTVELYGRIIEERYLHYNWESLGLKYMGEVPQQNVPQILSEAMLLILPSHTEGYPGVIIEAFSVGVPVVATRVGGIPEMIEDGKNGRLCDVGDTDALCEAVLSFTPQNYSIYSMNAIKAFDDNFCATEVNCRIYNQIACL